MAWQAADAPAPDLLLQALHLLLELLIAVLQLLHRTGEIADRGGCGVSDLAVSGRPEVSR